MTMTMAPPVVQPSLGLMALIHGVAEEENQVKVTPSDSVQDVHQLKHDIVSSLLHIHTYGFKSRINKIVPMKVVLLN